MTHPLSEELRKLAVSGIALGGTKDTLRRAADALDEACNFASELSATETAVYEKLKTAEAERDELRDLLTIIKSEYGGVVEDMATKDFADKVKTVDELRRQVKEGDELRQEYMDEWQKEASELRRQLAVSQRNCEDLKLTVLHVTEEK